MGVKKEGVAPEFTGDLCTLHGEGALYLEKRVVFLPCSARRSLMARRPLGQPGRLICLFRDLLRGVCTSKLFSFPPRLTQMLPPEKCGSVSVVLQEGFHIQSVHREAQSPSWRG